jgi:proteasome accessory factor BC
VARSYGTAGTLDEGVFVTDYSSLGLLASWVLRQDGRAVPVEPDALRREVARALKAVREAHEAEQPKLASELQAPETDGAGERPAGPVTPERFGVLQALLAYLLAACGAERAAEIAADEILERFPTIPHDELRDHLSLLNLVNFGGGCYTVYAELRDDGTVHVDKELYGETFRAAPRLTPLEARAIRLALEYVGPMIAADAHTPLDKVRRKLEETFGQFELAQTPEPHVEDAEEDLIRTLARGRDERRLVEIEYQKEVDAQPSTRVVEPYWFERALPHWYVHTWDQTSDGERSFRLDRMRSAKLLRERFQPRADFELTRLRGARMARVLYTPEIARYEIERGARPLVGGYALREIPVGSDEWLESDTLSKRGEAIVLEPADVRARIAERARELAKHLGVERMRVRA